MRVENDTLYPDEGKIFSNRRNPKATYSHITIIKGDKDKLPPSLKEVDINEIEREMDNNSKE